jgi:hypothetical protein
VTVVLPASMWAAMPMFLRFSIGGRKFYPVNI